MSGFSAFAGRLQITASAVRATAAVLRKMCTPSAPTRAEGGNVPVTFVSLRKIIGFSGERSIAAISSSKIRTVSRSGVESWGRHRVVPGQGLAAANNISVEIYFRDGMESLVIEIS
jgi:hypothetical protein